jgi:hypothetical protein
VVGCLAAVRIALHPPTALPASPGEDEDQDEGAHASEHRADTDHGGQDAQRLRGAGDELAFGLQGVGVGVVRDERSP